MQDNKAVNITYPGNMSASQVVDSFSASQIITGWNRNGEILYDNLYT